MSAYAKRGEGMDREVRSALRALRILERLVRHPEGLTLTELASEEGMARSSAHDLLSTLTRHGYLARGPGGRYTCGVRVLTLASPAGLAPETAWQAREALRRLVAAYGEATYLAVREGDRLRYVAAEQPRRVLGASSVGQAAPLHATAAGKALLAATPLAELVRMYGTGPLPARTRRTLRSVRELAHELEEVRTTGVAHDLEEFEEGLQCLAVPIWREGRVQAALGLSVPVARVSPEGLCRMAADLRRWAAALSETQPEPKGSPLVGWSMGSVSVPYYLEVRRAVKRLAEAWGVPLAWTCARDSHAKQYADVARLLSLGVRALVIHPAETREAAAIFRLAEEAGVPAVGFQRPARAPLMRWFVGGNTYEEGRLQGQFAAQTLGGRGRVVVLEGDAYNDNARNQAMGILDALGEHPGLTVILRHSCTAWSPEEAAEVMERLLARGEVPDAVIAGNDQMAGAVAGVLESAGLRDRVVLVGGDGDREALARLHAARQHATVFQNPAAVAEAGLRVAVSLAQGESLPEGARRRVLLRNPPGPEVQVWAQPYLLVDRERSAVLEEYWLRQRPGSEGTEAGAAVPGEG